MLFTTVQNGSQYRKLSSDGDKSTDTHVYVRSLVTLYVY